MGIDFHSHYMQIIRANLNKYPEKKLIIFPFGEQGMIFKNILNSAYDLHENYIIDNVLCNYNKNIFPLYSLENMDDKSLLFFLVATDKELNNKLYNQIKIKFPNAEIINVLEPLIIPVNDKEGWFKEFKELLGIKRLISNKQYVRIGRMNDGGYVMLDDIETNMKAYSFGICDDVSWDREMAERYGIDIYMYDHTITGLPEYHKKFHYFKAGISGKDDSMNHLFSIETILKNNAHTEETNLILKMDVEGAEYDFLESASPSIISNFKQMIFEFHNITKLENKERIKKSLQKLNETHQAVWIHGNNCNYAECDNGVIVPNTIEVLYLNKNYYSFEETNVYFPWDIDQPNKYKLNDFILGNW